MVMKAPVWGEALDEICSEETLLIVPTPAGRLFCQADAQRWTTEKHLVFACVSTVMIWIVWWVHFRGRKRSEPLPSYRLAIELMAFAIVALTAHLGGFLSGVNGPG